MTNHKTWKLWEGDRIHPAEAELLRRKTSDISFPLHERDRKDIEKLIDAFTTRDDALGLAAPQIGICKRVVIFKNKDFNNRTPVRNEKDYDILVNPRITQCRGNEETMTEGCLSCPEVSAEVTRFTEIKVRALDRQGNRISKRYTGFLARIVQHELDHLEGILIIDHGGSIYVPEGREDFFTQALKDKRILRPLPAGEGSPDEMG
ncbi:MAG TPA: peptide deformylase [Syntrophales bacterium]|nr:peptide deformylase [Syntrophales bacterium]